VRPRAVPKQGLGLFPVCMEGAPAKHVHTEDCVLLYELRRCDKYMWDWIVKAAPVTCGYGDLLNRVST